MKGFSNRDMLGIRLTDLEQFFIFFSFFFKDEIIVEYPTGIKADPYQSGFLPLRERDQCSQDASHISAVLSLHRSLNSGRIERAGGGGI